MAKNTNRDEKGKYNTRPKEEWAKDLKHKITLFKTKNDLLEDTYFNMPLLRTQEPNLLGSMKQFGDQYLETQSAHAVIKELGMHSKPYNSIAIADIEEITKQAITQEVAKHIYEQAGKTDIANNFLDIRKRSMKTWKAQHPEAKKEDVKKKKQEFQKLEQRSKEAWEKITSPKSTYRLYEWERYVDKLYPELKAYYGLKLSDAIKGKETLTDAVIDRKLYEWLVYGYNLTTSGLRLIGPEGTRVEAAIRKRPAHGKIPIKAEFKKRNSHQLAKYIPEERGDEDTITTQEFRFMLEIIKRYDKKLEVVTELSDLFANKENNDSEQAQEFKNQFKQGIGQTKTYYEAVTYKNKNGSLSTKADLRVQAGGLEYLVNVVTPKEANASNPAFEITNNAKLAKQAAYWEDNTPIDKKIIIANTYSTLVKEAKKHLNLEAAINEPIKKGMKNDDKLIIFSGREMRRIYQKALELLKDEEPNFFTVAATRADHIDKVLSRLRPRIPYLKRWDIQATGPGPIKTVAYIAEEHIRFIFNVASKYPDADLPYVKAFIPNHIKKIYGTDKESNGQAKLMTPLGDKETDFVIETVTEEYYLIEVKNVDHLSNTAISNEVHKYAPITHLANGKPIKKKLIVFNSRPTRLEKNKWRFEDIDFTVWNGAEINHEYRRAVETLGERWPTIYTDNEMPLPGQLEEQQRAMYDFQHIIRNESNKLYKNGQGLNRHHHLEFFRTLNKTIEQGTRKKIRHFIKTMPREIIRPFSDWQHQFPHINLKDYEVEKVLFEDTETAGHVRSGKPLFIDALGYHNGYEMINHLLIARTPMEEPYIIERFLEISEGMNYLVDFSGTWFDQPFKKERHITQGFPYPEIEHIDLRKVFNQYLKKKGQHFPHAKLQTFEKVFLNFIREHDINGRTIPQKIYNFLFHGLVKGVEHAIEHGGMDVIPMPIMWHYFDKEKLLPLPQNYSQATLQFT